MATNPIAVPGYEDEQENFNPVDISADITRLPDGASA